MAEAEAPRPNVGLATPSRRVQRAVTWAGLACAAAGGLAWYLLSGRYVTSDNAYVKADVIEIASRIDGAVASVSVRTDQMVKTGDELIRLDDTEARIALAQAEAELDAAINDIESLRLQVSAAEASLAGARATLAYREREARRLEGLAAQGIASRVSFDAAVEQARAARDAATLAERQLRELVARLGGDPSRPAAGHPEVKLRQAAIQAAQVRLGYTVIHAPRAAQAGVVEVHGGEQVEAGTRLLSLVGTASPWLEVNLKETQVGRLAAGQPVQVRVDAFPGRTWAARVASLGPATGAEFALLPPENASGNWVKVVQRVPVRIEFEPAGPGPALRAGMSAEVVIDTGDGNRRYQRLARRIGPTSPPP